MESLAWGFHRFWTVTFSTVCGFFDNIRRNVWASGDLEGGLDGDLLFDANLNRHAKITGRAYGLKMAAQSS